MRFPRFGLVLFVCLVLAAVGAACGSSNNSSAFSPKEDASVSDGNVGDGSGSSSGGGDGPNLLKDASGGGDASGTLVISPANKSIVVPYGTQAPTVTFTASEGGQNVAASFAIDLGQIGSIVAATGVMTPTGKVGGTANVTATFGAQKATTKVTVVLQLQDNGAPAGTDAGGGAGGNGGVGGSGPGGPVSGTTQVLLQGTLTADPGLAWLYPYDKTVWPQGLLAPLLQWNAPRSYDSLYIHLHENGFDYQGFFAAEIGSRSSTRRSRRPRGTRSSYSNQGDPVSVTLAFSAGGKAYGPLTETWTIAQGTADRDRLLQLVRDGPRPQLLLHRWRGEPALRRGDARHQARRDEPRARGRHELCELAVARSAACATRWPRRARRSSRSTATPTRSRARTPSPPETPRRPSARRTRSSRSRASRPTARSSSATRRRSPAWARRRPSGLFAIPSGASIAEHRVARRPGGRHARVLARRQARRVQRLLDRTRSRWRRWTSRRRRTRSPTRRRCTRRPRKRTCSRPSCRRTTPWSSSTRRPTPASSAPRATGRAASCGGWT